MVRKLTWLVIVVLLMLLNGNALAAIPVPADTADFHIPSYTIPTVSSVEVSGNDISVDVEGNVDTISVSVGKSIDIGQVTYENITLEYTGGKYHATVPYAIYDYSTIKLSNTASSFKFNYYFDDESELYLVVCNDQNGGEIYFDDNGKVDYYTGDHISAEYDENGHLEGYIIYADDVTKCFDQTGTLKYDYSFPDSGVIIRKYSPSGTILENIQAVDDKYFEIRNTNGEVVEQRSFGYDDEWFDGWCKRYENGVVVYSSESGFSEDNDTVWEKEYIKGEYAGQYIRYTEDEKLEQYDAAGKLIAVTIPGDNETCIYDGEGNLTQRIVPNNKGNQTFDANGQLIKYEVVDGKTTYTYDANNNLLRLDYIEQERITVADWYYPGIIFTYIPAEDQWYLNGNKFFGTPPVSFEKKYTWYPNNTVCSFGPQFRDVNPSLTDLWYMFTPIDLSKDGMQTFELIGGNTYVLGTVNVIVSGDKVTVNYNTAKGKYGHIYVKSEYLNFFPDLASVNTVLPEEIGEGYSFGKEISISKDLKGDTNVLMFIRNVATFRDYVTDDAKLRRYYKNYPSRKVLRDKMLAMMD